MTIRAPSPVAAWLAAVKKRAEAATRGPWEAEDGEDCWQLFGAVTPGLHPLQLIKAPKRDTPFAEYWPGAADAEFIAHARTDVPPLAAALEAVLALADEWETRAKDMDDGTGMTLTSVRAQVLYECASRTRVAVAAELPAESALRDTQDASTENR